MNTNAHTTPLSEIIDQIGPGFAEKAPHNDATDTFVSENFEVLKQHKMFSAMIPAELGGGGVSYSDFCDAIRQLGTYCGPTALTLSMHSHLTAAAIFNVRGLTCTVVSQVNACEFTWCCDIGPLASVSGDITGDSEEE